MIFLDNASTTKARPECLEIAKKYFFDDYYNPSAPYHGALNAAKDIKEARQKILQILSGEGRIVFTASGTEADNLALFGTKKPNKSTVIISATEHSAVYNCAKELENRGFTILEAPVDAGGRVIENGFADLMNTGVSLVSIMHVNNETGAINDIKNLCRIAKSINPDVIFHSDGIQAAGKIKVSLNDAGVDLYSLSGHKFHAPKGVGALYVKRGVSLRPIIYGGGQEGNLRSATENVCGIVCMAFALEQAAKAHDENYDRAQILRKKVIEGLADCAKVISPDISSPYILSLALKRVRGEVMLHSLEKYGIMIGTGSACSNQKSAKRTQRLYKLPPEYENGIIRVSFSDLTTENDIDIFINKLNLEYLDLLKYTKE